MAIGVRERWLRVRNRLLASARFQRVAARTPIARGVAARDARALFDLCAGFVYSQVLQACVRLDVFDRFDAEPADARTFAHASGLPEGAVARLLDAGVALRLLDKLADGRYALGRLGAALRANPGVLAMISHHRLLYDDLADPVALLDGSCRPTRLERFWAYSGCRDRALDAAAVAEYTSLMAASQHLVAEDVLDAYRFARHRRLLDVGGGDASFAAEVAHRAPELELRCLELPAVAERARGVIAARGLGQRISVIGGDFLRDPLPEGADLVTLVRVLHDHDDADAVRLLRAVRRALPADGRLLIAEPMAGTPGAEPMGDAYFGPYLLAMGSGRPRSARRIESLALSAGFSACRPVRTRRPLLTGVVICDA